LLAAMPSFSSSTMRTCMTFATSATREIYVHDSVRLGIRRNRARVLVRRDEIAAIARFDEIASF